MILEVLVEEPSAKAALEVLLPKIVPDVMFNVHAFEGKPDLLAKLPRRLAGYSHFHDAFVVVLVDRDTDSCMALKRRLVTAARRAGIGRRVLARIAVEELEAWLLGDVPALAAAFRGVPPSLARRARFRDPDAVLGGTAEALLEVLREAGHNISSKVEVARTVAQHMDVENNRSYSFRVFRDGIRQRLRVA